MFARWISIKKLNHISIERPTDIISVVHKNPDKFTFAVSEFLHTINRVSKTNAQLLTQILENEPVSKKTCRIICTHI